jgi:hypothetical protein
MKFKAEKVLCRRERVERKREEVVAGSLVRFRAKRRWPLALRVISVPQWPRDFSTLFSCLHSSYQHPTTLFSFDLSWRDIMAFLPG